MRKACPIVGLSRTTLSRAWRLSHFIEEFPQLTVSVPKAYTKKAERITVKFTDIMPLLDAGTIKVNPTFLAMRLEVLREIWTTKEKETQP